MRAGLNGLDVNVISSQRAFEHIVRLAGDIGVRVAGTPPEKTGAEYLASVFREAGYTPALQGFPHPVWQEKRTHLEVEGLGEIPALSPCFGGIGVVEGEITAVGDPFCLENVTNLDLHGKIALVDGRDVEVDYPDTPQTDLLLGCGAVGLIFMAGEGQIGGLPQAYYNYKRWFHGGTPVSAIVSYADGQRLKSRRACLSVEAQVFWSESFNVIAELRGSERPDEIIIVSAHNDSTPTSPGARDNAGGCAIVAELARALSQAGLAKRTVCFVQFGGHETGLHGSEALLRTNIYQAEQILANINFDGQGMLGGQDRAWVLGSPVWNGIVERVIQQNPIPILYQPAGVDMSNFAALGISGVNFGKHGEARVHTPADNLEGMGPAGLEPALQLSADLLWEAANSLDFCAPQRMPWEQFRAARSYCQRWGWGLVA